VVVLNGLNGEGPGAEGGATGEASRRFWWRYKRAPILTAVGGGRTDASEGPMGYANSASATISAAIAESKGNINSDPRGYRAGNPHTDVVNPDVAQATGWKGGQALVDRYGKSSNS
jgi:hypothetical protein